MNKWVAINMFNMRPALPQENQLYEKMLKSISIPLGKDVMDTEVDYCDICHKKKQVVRTYYHYDIPCECCGGQYHFEYVKTCQDCEPEPPKWIRTQVKPIGF